jgi:hypothetical protein
MTLQIPTHSHPLYSQRVLQARRKERLKTLAIVLLVASGWAYGMYTDSQAEDIAAEAYFVGYQEAREELKSGKAALFVSQVCTGWWFGNNDTQRAATRKQMCGGTS